MDKHQLDKLYAVFPDMDDATYYKTISAKGKVVIAMKKAEGERMHLAPLGYKNARDELGRSVLVPDPETYELVLEARRLRAEGMSIRKICAAMHRKGLRSSHGSILSPMGVWKLLRAIEHL